MNDNRNLVVVVLVVVLLIGITGVFVFGGRRGSQTEITAAEVPDISSSEIVVTEEVAEGSSVVENTQEPTVAAVEESVPPTPRTGLESTDPAVVSLASGEIQLVEFFAFW